LIRVAAGFVATVIVVLTAGCGPVSADRGNGTAEVDNGNSQAAARNPCELVTAAELATIVATVDGGSAPEMKQTKETGEFQGRVCAWQYPKKELVTDTADVSVTAWHGKQYYTPDVTGGFTAVPGIGDAAHEQPSMFMFRKGDDVVLVTVLGDANGNVLRKEIAKLIAGKL
jgi:hypothetical protein